MGNTILYYIIGQPVSSSYFACEDFTFKSYEQFVKFAVSSAQKLFWVLSP